MQTWFAYYQLVYAQIPILFIGTELFVVKSMDLYLEKFYNKHLFIEYKLESVSTYLGPCKFRSACNPSQNLICNVTEQTPNTCQCHPYDFWDNINLICIAQKTKMNTCLNTYECLSGSGLYCSSGYCLCQSNYFWYSPYNVCGKYFLKLIGF